MILSQKNFVLFEHSFLSKAFLFCFLLTISPTLLGQTLEVRETNSSGLLLNHNDPAASLRDFGNHGVHDGKTGWTTIHIENAGNIDLQLGTLFATEDFSEFELNDSGWKSTLKPTKKFTFKVRFDPTSAGTKNLVLSFTHNDSTQTSPFIINFIGVGTPTPILEIRETDNSGLLLAHNDSATSLRDFGNQGVHDGETGWSMIYIENAGDADLSLGALSSGGDVADFELDSGSWQSTLGAAENFTIQVRFDPTSTGTKSLTLSFAHNDGDITSPFIVNFTGVGTGIPGLWNGKSSTDWSDTLNWNDNNVPNSIAVTIPTGTPYYPNITTTLIAITTLTIDNGASLTIAGNGKLTCDSVTLHGTLTLSADNSVLSLSDTSTLNIGANATLSLSGSNPSHASTAASLIATSGSWSISLVDTASMSASGARFVDGVIHFDDASPAPALFRITNTLFSSLPTGTTEFIDFSGWDNTNAGAIQMAAISLERGTNVAAASARNFKADADTPEFIIGGYSGNLSGELFDNDPRNKIRWTNSPIQYRVRGDITTRAYTLDAAISGLNGGTRTISTHYLDGSTLKSAFGYYYGTLNLPNTFTGTLNIDGVVFVTTGASATLISGGHASGTVNLYNCMLLDPNDSTNDPTAQGRTLVNAASTINADFCTIDGQSTGLSTITNSLDRNGANGFGIDSSSWFVDYTNRDLHLTKTGADNVSTATRNATYIRDVNGSTRESGANNTYAGASHYSKDNAIILALNDVTTGISVADPSAIIFGLRPAYNFLSKTFYLSGSDGTHCYLTVFDRFNQTLRLTAKWSGARAGWVSRVQSSDANKHWLYVSYDSDGDGYYDAVRRFLHDTKGTLNDAGDDTLQYPNNVDITGTNDGADVGSGSLSDAGGNAIDFGSSGGWSGALYLQTEVATGASEVQVALSTLANNGEIHAFYMNESVSSGDFYSTTAFTTSGQASESYVSGSYNLAPNPHAPVILFGSGNGGGTMTFVRTADSTDNEVLVVVDRPNNGVTETIDSPLTHLNHNLGENGSFSADPLPLFRADGRRLGLHTNSPQATLLAPWNASDVTTIDLGSSGLNVLSDGYGGPLGVLPEGRYNGGFMFLPYYNGTTGLGSIVAVEYKNDWNSDASYEVLDASYSDDRLHFTGDGNIGSFSSGIAEVVGRPTQLWQSYSTEAIYCITEAGLLYGWRSGGAWNTEDSSIKGSLLSNFPVRLSSRITAINTLFLDDNDTGATKKDALGIAAGGGVEEVLGLFTESGQVLLLKLS